MTMHLAHPAFTMSGKRKGKVKFRNAEEARKSRELKEEWERKQKEWAKLSPLSNKPVRKDDNWTYNIPVPVGRENRKIPSKVTTGGNTALKEIPKYTGTEMIGITIVHKSGLQPVFNQESAKDAASMRR